jgi:DNA-directed RNA polymerase subunit N (RpoN/RPB10)
MKGILDLIKLIYGSKALSKTLGTRTNVIRLPDNEVKRYIKEELNIEAASDKLAQKAKEEMGELIADLPKMNDAEKLILEGNLRRLANKLGVAEKGPAADVIQFTTKEKISPEGVMSLTEKIGQKNAPGTLMGNLESRIKQLEASGEDLSKLKGKTYDEFMKDITQGQKSMRKLEDEGLVRATAREIIGRDIKSGKIKLPKEIEQDIVQGGGEPINVFRKFYGEDALEQLDSMIPEFKNMYSPREAADAATKKFKFEFKADRPPESISIEDAKKAEQEFGINKPKQNEVTDITAKVYRNADPDELIGEYNKNLDLLSQVDEEGGTLIGYEQFKKLQNRNTEIEKILNSIGIKSADSPEGKKITEALIGKPKASVTELVTAEKIISDMKNMDPMDAMKEANKVLKKEGKYKNLQEKDVERIMEDTNDFIFGRDIPEDPEGFAVGGRVEMAAGGITKLVKKAMEFFSDNDPVSAYKKYLKYVKETAQKDPAKLAPEMGGIVVGSELIHRGLRRKLKEAKEKNNTDDSEDTTTEDRTEKAGGGVSQGLDYLTGIERRGYANGDYAVQAGIKNYLGKQKTATVPIKWKSGKGDSHPDTELAYITKPEKDLLIKLDMHNSMPDGEPNIGPGGLISLNSGGDGGAGGGDGGNGDGGDDGGNGDGGDDGGNGDGGSNASDTGDTGSEAGNDAASASAAAGGSGSSGTDTGDMGSEAANAAATSAANASVGMGWSNRYRRFRIRSR